VRTRTAATAAQAGWPAAAVLVTAGLAALSALGAAPPALAAQARPGHFPAARAASPAFTNPGATSPSLSLSVNPGGEPEVASVGKNGSLWFTRKAGEAWHRTKVAGNGTAASGPSLVAEPGGRAIIAVEGPSHSLQYFSLSAGHWHRSQIAGKGTAYSAPSLSLGPNGPGIAVQGPGRSLLYIGFRNGRWTRHVVNGRGTTYSAPSLVIRGTSQAVTGHPMGEADIAAENAMHSLSYYTSVSHAHWLNDLIGGPNTTYSAPSLVVLGGAVTFEGTPVLFVQGAHHSLLAYSVKGNGVAGSVEVEGNNWCFSAPSLAQGNGATPFPVAFIGPSRSLFVVFEDNPATHSWQNDPVASANTTYSAPALFVRNTSPAGELDVVAQGSGDSMMYYHAPMPPSGAPSFTGQTIAGPGTTFGG
jgi:hypothetical protein